MKPVVMIVADHVLRAFENEMRVMAEPEDVQHERVPEVHNGPQQEARPEGTKKRCAAVHIAQDQTEDDDEQNARAELGRELVLLRGDLILVLGKCSDPLLDLRRVIVQTFDRLPGHEIHHHGENKAQDDALNYYDHSLTPFINRHPGWPRDLLSRPPKKGSHFVFFIGAVSLKYRPLLSCYRQAWIVPHCPFAAKQRPKHHFSDQLCIT